MIVFGVGASTCGPKCEVTRLQPKQRGHRHGSVEDFASRAGFWRVTMAADRVTPFLAGADEDAVLGLRFFSSTDSTTACAGGST